MHGTRPEEMVLRIERAMARYEANLKKKKKWTRKPKSGRARKETKPGKDC